MCSAWSRPSDGKRLGPVKQQHDGIAFRELDSSHSRSRASTTSGALDLDSVRNCAVSSLPPWPELALSAAGVCAGATPRESAEKTPRFTAEMPRTQRNQTRKLACQRIDGFHVSVVRLCDNQDRLYFRHIYAKALEGLPLDIPTHR